MPWEVMIITLWVVNVVLALVEVVKHRNSPVEHILIPTLVCLLLAGGPISYIGSPTTFSWFDFPWNVAWQILNQYNFTYGLCVVILSVLAVEQQKLCFATQTSASE
jgi:hypothetical protein